ncbi:hypothetical protein AOB60_01300 [Streptomyces noursei]|uniref:Uncharacterized protein n=2 Tax=Streptomyces noursei TaxID=1971 RepID=A0A2N8PR80_STRNR|nr:hypothetical protein AOB60_01300 [Streptomyces noursei]
MSVCTIPQSSFASASYVPAQPFGLFGQQLPLAAPFVQGYPQQLAQGYPLPVAAAQEIYAGGQQIPEFARQVAWVLSTALVECARWIIPVIQTNLASHQSIRGVEPKMNLSSPQLATSWSNGTSIPQPSVAGPYVPAFATMGV